MDSNGNDNISGGAGVDLAKSMAGVELGKRGLPKLREIIIRNREDSECGPSVDIPELDFVYADSDSLEREIGELYSFTELPEFALNQQHYSDTVSELGLDVRWPDMSPEQRTAVVLRLVDKVELARRDDRLRASRALLYICQGCWADLQTPEEVQSWSHRNVLLLYKCGVLSVLVEILNLEIEGGTGAVAAIHKMAVSVADSSDLRVLLSVLYLMVEQMRHVTDSAPADHVRLRNAFVHELGQCQDTGELLAVSLLGMISRFCSGSAPHFPMKKVLLLTWKVLLLTLGGSEQLRRMRTSARAAAGLPDVPEDTVERTRTMRASSPPPAPAEALTEAVFGPQRPRFTRSSVVNADAMESMSDSTDFTDERGKATEPDPNGQDDRSPPRCDSPRPDTPVHHGRALPWKPKVHRRDIEEYLSINRKKFVGFRLEDDLQSMAGLPQSILEGRSILDKHLYRSLAEVQVDREEELITSPFSLPEEEVPQTPAELLFAGMLPNLPQYMIALLKVLLAAAPTSKTKTDSINILADTLPEEMPMSVLHSMRLGIDVNRQKEVIAKAVSAILLLLLKHLKLNHVYQFEFVSQHLVFANCIPLVLKFFNQDIVQYVTAKNSIPALDFPRCVLGPQADLTSETLQLGEEQPFCWRNVFTSINLLRILNKLCKWKHSRIMMLVVFKSAPILKRSLRVKHAMMQVYTLKLLKMQTKYLGRQWRKSNMRTVSAIYQKVRHRLVDDWAYGNEVDARPWDYEAEERALRSKVDHFITRRYNPDSLGDLEPVDVSLSSVLATKLELTPEFKANYRRWLHREVYQQTIDWDKLIEPGYMG